MYATCPHYSPSNLSLFYPCNIWLKIRLWNYFGTCKWNSFNTRDIQYLNSPVVQPRNLVTQLTDVHSFYIMLVCASYIGIKLFSILLETRAIAQAVSRWLSTAAARVRSRVWSSGICGGALDRFSPSTSVSPANLHSTKFSIIINNWGRYNRPISGRRAAWTQLDSTPH
jgi:hypothetical protein